MCTSKTEATGPLGHLGPGEWGLDLRCLLLLPAAPCCPLQSSAVISPRARERGLPQRRAHGCVDDVNRHHVLGTYTPAAVTACNSHNNSRTADICCPPHFAGGGREAQKSLVSVLSSYSW